MTESIIDSVKQGLLESQRNLPVQKSVTMDYSPTFLQILIKRETGRVWTEEDLNVKESGFENMDDRLADDIGHVFSKLRDVGLTPRFHDDGSVTIKVIGTQTG